MPIIATMAIATITVIVVFVSIVVCFKLVYNLNAQ